jgi:hypothetical protein
MPYYDTLEEDVARAKLILAKGKPAHDEVAYLAEPMRETALAGGTIYGADVYAAYKLLESFVAAIEAVGPKVCELALRHEQAASTGTLRPKAPPPLPSITCPFCGKTSYHPKDIEERYCGHCHRFRTEDGEAVPDCLCRTRGCGHLASQHTGHQGACTVEGCDCGPGGWS